MLFLLHITKQNIFLKVLFQSLNIIHMNILWASRFFAQELQTSNNAKWISLWSHCTVNHTACLNFPQVSIFLPYFVIMFQTLLQICIPLFFEILLPKEKIETKTHSPKTQILFFRGWQAMVSFDLQLTDFWNDDLHYFKWGSVFWIRVWNKSFGFVLKVLSLFWNTGLFSKSIW